MAHNLNKFKSVLIPLIPISLYVAHRLWVVLTGRCPLDSDEAIFGIMGMEALRGQFRAFYHGQDYLGSFQALASIPFLVLLGASPLALRVTAIAEGAVILLCWRRIFRKWSLPREAWFLFALLFAFGPN